MGKGVFNDYCYFLTSEVKDKIAYEKQKSLNIKINNQKYDKRQLL
jgi:hypothetical protein